MKVGIVGYRNYTNTESVYETLDNLNIVFTEIISGGASGVDAIAKRYAAEKKIPYTEYAADWKKYGKKAGPIRNVLIAKACDVLIAFLHKNSVGTRHIINVAKKLEKDVIIIQIA